MLFAHRDREEDNIIIHGLNGPLKVRLTHDIGFKVSDLWKGIGFPTITWTWTLTREDSRKHITSINRLRNYFHYTEIEYTPHIKHWLNVYINQFKAAQEILECYQYGINSVILTAEMQSGKSGTARYVVHSLLHHSGPNSNWDRRMKSENIYFICGMNDNDLRAQAIAEFSGLIPAANILFSKQLQKWLEARDKDKEDEVAMVIVDESHYASNVNSLVDKFLKYVAHRDQLHLSISATAMAELATSQSQGKAMVYLKPGDNYYSIRDIFSRGLVKQSINITTHQADFIELITEEYEHQHAHNELKYNIVRIPNQWYYQDLEEDIKEQCLDIDFINHHTYSGSLSSSSSSSSLQSALSPSISDFNDYIKEKPKKTTIIWIYGSLRAGKQLNTEHIGFVHDTSNSGPDTIAQSLLGRILGYNKRNNHVKCYTDVQSAKLMCTWMTNVYDITKIPSGSKGIINGYTDAIKKWNLHPPLAVMLSYDVRSYYRALKQKHGNRYPYKLEFIDAVINAADGITKSEVQYLFETHVPGRCGGLMVLTENNANRTFNDYWDYNYKSWLTQSAVRGFDALSPGNYYYIYANLNINSSEYGVVLITRKEYINSKTGADYVKVKNTSRFQSQLRQ